MHSWLTQLPPISIYYFHPSHPFPFFNILKDCADQSNGLRLVSLSPFIYLFFFTSGGFHSTYLASNFSNEFFRHSWWDCSSDQHDEWQISNGFLKTKQYIKKGQDKFINKKFLYFRVWLIHNASYMQLLSVKAVWHKSD